MVTEATIEAEKRVKAVLRAHGTPDPFDDLVAHMGAVDLGPAVLPIIRDSVLSIDWSTPKPRGKVGVLTALMLVAHDVDEQFARDLSVELASEQHCHSLFLHRLSSINNFTLDDYQESEFRGVRILVPKVHSGVQYVTEYLHRWIANIPDVDLTGISRLYVVEKQERRYWGEYLRILSKISLVWRGWERQSLRQRLATEYTLYHEVGHHVHRGQRCDRQESEALADSYANNRFALSHPYIGRGLVGKCTVAVSVGIRPSQREFA